MKVTKSQLKQIIKEELKNVISENWNDPVQAQDVFLEQVATWMETNRDQLRNHDDLLQLFTAAADEAGLVTGMSLANVPGADGGVVNQALNIHEKFMKGILP